MKKIIICLICMFLSFILITARDYHVTTGDELQDALIDAEDNGEDDVIYMSSGIYYRINESGERYADFEYDGIEQRSLTVMGEPGTSSSDIIIDAYNSGFCLDLDCLFFVPYEDYTPELVVSGISFRNGNTNECSGGLSIYAPEYDVTVKNCEMTDNVTYIYSGGGVRVISRSVKMESNKILYNTCYDQAEYGETENVQGGGLFISANHDSYLINNIIAFNSSIPVAGEESSYGGGIYIQFYNADNEAFSFINNTIYDNYAYEGGGVYFKGLYGPRLDFYNNIIYSNSANLSGGGNDIFVWYNHSFPGHEPVRIYSHHNNYSDLVFGGVIEELVNNMDINPGFVNAASADFHLSFSSPMIGEGTEFVPDPPGLPDYDFENDPRINGSAVDIGADEYQLLSNIQKPFKARIIVMDIIGPEILFKDIEKFWLNVLVYNDDYKAKKEIWILQVSKEGVKYYTMDGKWSDKEIPFYQGAVDGKLDVKLSETGITKPGKYDYYIISDEKVDGKVSPDAEVEDDLTVLIFDEKTLVIK